MYESIFVQYVCGRQQNDFEIKQMCYLPLRSFLFFFSNCRLLSCNIFVLYTAFEILFCTTTKNNCTIKSYVLDNFPSAVMRLFLCNCKSYQQQCIPHLIKVFHSCSCGTVILACLTQRAIDRKDKQSDFETGQ